MLLFFFILIPKYCNCFHIHTANSSKKSPLQILLYNMLILFIIFVFLCRLCELFSKHLHLLLISCNDLVYLQLYFILIYLLLSFTSSLSENISPAIQRFHFQSFTIKDSRLLHLKFKHLLIELIFVEKSERPR